MNVYQVIRDDQHDGAYFTRKDASHSRIEFYFWRELPLAIVQLLEDMADGLEVDVEFLHIASADAAESSEPKVRVYRGRARGAHYRLVALSKIFRPGFVARWDSAAAAYRLHYHLEVE